MKIRLAVKPLSLALAAIALLSLTACQGNFNGEGTAAVSTQGASAATGSVDVVEVAEQGDKAWLDVASGQIRPASGEAPTDAYVEGHLTPEGFQPTSHVIGKYSCLCGIEKFMHKLTTGWRDMSTGKFVEKTRDTSPQRPFLLGQINEEGKFFPDSRVVTF